VALGEDETVVVGMAGIVGKIAEGAAEEQAGHEFHCGERRGGVTGAGLRGAGQNEVADIGGQAGQVLQIRGHEDSPCGTDGRFGPFTGTRG